MIDQNDEESQSGARADGAFLLDEGEELLRSYNAISSLLVRLMVRDLITTLASMEKPTERVLLIAAALG